MFNIRECESCLARWLMSLPKKTWRQAAIGQHKARRPPESWARVEAMLLPWWEQHRAAVLARRSRAT